jgi:hypothetical protein
VRKVLVALAVLILAVVALTGCAETAADSAEAAEEAAPVTVTETVGAESTTQEAPLEETTTEEAEQNAVVPDVTGKRLDLAESKLDELGIGHKEIGGGTFGVVVASNWIVCDQDPKSGGSSNSVKLVVARRGECGPAATVGSAGTGSKGLPTVTGKRLDVAEAILDKRGIVYEEVGGGLFGIVVTSNWVVCDQRPKPGADTRRVQLIVDRPGEC